jgi:hypothetical protein
MSTDIRPGCTAIRHDTCTAYKRAGCRCPKARQAETARKAKYDRNRAERPRYGANNMVGLVKPGAPDFRTHPARGCARLDNPDVMFAEHQPGIQAAKQVCAPCPFKTECDEWAVEHAQLYGVWGGVSAGERRPIIYVRHRLGGQA